MSDFTEQDFIAMFKNANDPKWSEYEARGYNQLTLQLATLHKFQKEKAKEHKLYEYFITFTLKEYWHNKSECWEDIGQKVCQYANMTQIDAFQWWYSLEHTKKGVAHYHVVCRSKKIVKKDYFRTYLQTYGDIDLQKITVGTSERVKRYLLKENPPIDQLSIIKIPASNIK